MGRRPVRRLGRSTRILLRRRRRARKRPHLRPDRRQRWTVSTSALSAGGAAADGRVDVGELLRNGRLVRRGEAENVKVPGLVELATVRGRGRLSLRWGRRSVRSARDERSVVGRGRGGQVRGTSQRAALVGARGRGCRSWRRRRVRLGELSGEESRTADTDRRCQSSEEKNCEEKETHAARLKPGSSLPSARGKHLRQTFLLRQLTNPLQNDQTRGAGQREVQTRGEMRKATYHVPHAQSPC